jgi:hypothetical protein
MSLINDALRRTQKSLESQPPNPAPPLELRPAEPPVQSQPRSQTKILVLAFLCLGLGILVFGVLLPGRNVQRVQARTAPRSATAARKTFPITPALSQFKPTTILESLSSTDSPPIVVQSPSNSLPETIAAPVATTPVPLRLQAILFNPSRPSAIIDRTTVFIGDTLRGFKIAGISQDRVVLVSATETNVLKLE